MSRPWRPRRWPARIASVSSQNRCRLHDRIVGEGEVLGKDAGRSVVGPDQPDPNGSLVGGSLLSLVDGESLRPDRHVTTRADEVLIDEIRARPIVAVLPRGRINIDF